MKIKPAQTDRFVAKPDPAMRAILVYGPDEGLVRTRMKLLTQSRLGQDPDPLSVTELSDGDLKSDPARLSDEAQALSLIGGGRVVRLRINGEAAPAPLKGLVEDWGAGGNPPEALILVEAGDLSPRSSLRKLFEASDLTAAIACYPDDERALASLVTSVLSAHELKVSPDAQDLLTARLGSDRGVSLQELEKIALFKGMGGGTISVDDVDACLPADEMEDAGQLADLVAGGRLDHLLAALDRARSLGTSPVALVRGVLMHFGRLHQWSGHIAKGQSAEDILKRARPPIHFSRTASLKFQLSAWSQEDLGRAVGALTELERQTKSTGLPDWALLERTLLSLARRPARMAPRRQARGR